MRTTSIQEKTALVRESARPLAPWGGTQPDGGEIDGAEVMVRADTSVRIEHFRHGLMHSFISGELGCGNLKDRAVILS